MLALISVCGEPKFQQHNVKIQQENNLQNIPEAFAFLFSGSVYLEEDL